MTLAKDLAMVQKIARSCAVKRILDVLGVEDETALIDALKDKTISSRSLASMLTAHGYDIKHGSINDHRRRDCRCPS